MRNMLIADSGSTKTDWLMGDMRMQTQGINPFHQDEDAIRTILREELLPQMGERRPEGIAFYGSGVRPELEEKMAGLLGEIFPEVGEGLIQAHGDLLGAARALCGRQRGIACILGTGANSCLYDGQHIVQNTPPMGYILGDEGSGAVMGARFLNALYKKRLPATLQVAFEDAMQLSLADVIDRVYRQPLANRWLASLSVFIHQHLGEPGVHRLVVENFLDFIDCNIEPYGRRDLPLSAVGSIAYYYQQQLAEAARERGYAVGRILRSPIDGLAEMEHLGG